MEAIKAETGIRRSGVVNRRIRKGTTVKGSSKFHVFADIGITGHLVCRERGCHSPNCQPCWKGKYKSCTQIPRDSFGLAQAGHPLLPHDRQITPDGSAEHMVPITRNALCQRGINLATGLEGELKVGDSVAVYVEDTTEKMMLGKILELQYTITEADAVYSWMGQMEVGDKVLLLHKFNPIGPNGTSSRYWRLKDPAKKAAQFSIWIEDI